MDDPLYVRIQIDVPIYTQSQYNDKDYVAATAQQMLAAQDVLVSIVDDNGEDADILTLEPGFTYGDREGTLPGTGRSWEIADFDPDGDEGDLELDDDGDPIAKPNDFLFTVWYAGCEHGGDFYTYDEAIESIRPNDLGD